MNIILIFIIAVSLSMDAFSLSLAYGTINLRKKDINIFAMRRFYHSADAPPDLLFVFFHTVFVQKIHGQKFADHFRSSELLQHIAQLWLEQYHQRNKTELQKCIICRQHHVQL